MGRTNANRAQLKRERNAKKAPSKGSSSQLKDNAKALSIVCGICKTSFVQSASKKTLDVHREREVKKNPPRQGMEQRPSSESAIQRLGSAIRPTLKILNDTVRKEVSTVLSYIGGQGSRSFLEFVRSLSECTSRSACSEIVSAEAKILRELVPKARLTSTEAREYIVRLLLCELLGEDVSFGHVLAVKLTQSGLLANKQASYLAVRTFLTPQSELVLLLVASLQKDLKSNNVPLQITLALDTVAALITAETAPAILPSIRTLLSHRNDTVRIKALLALRSIFRRAPHLVTAVIRSDLLHSLQDPCPRVMSVALVLVDDLIESDGSKASFLSLFTGLCNILAQVIDRKMPAEYSYGRVPAPWTQIRLLRLIALLAAGDRHLSESAMPVLRGALMHASAGTATGAAVLAETVRTISHLAPNAQLLSDAAASLSGFFSHPSKNFKCTAVSALTEIVRADPRCAEQYQVQIVDCLEDSDVTLKRRTLELLKCMTSSKNVALITQKMIEHSSCVPESDLRHAAWLQTVSLAEKHCTSRIWLLEQLIIMLGAQKSSDDCRTAQCIAQRIRTLLNSHVADTALWTRATELVSPMLSDGRYRTESVVVFVCWVLSRSLSVLSNGKQAVETFDLIERGGLRRADMVESSLLSVLSCLLKIYRDHSTKQNSADLNARLHDALSFCSQHAFCTLANFAQLLQSMKRQQLLSAFSHDVRDADNLDFSSLDTYVQERVASGCKPFVAPSLTAEGSTPLSPTSVSTTTLLFSRKTSESFDTTEQQLVESLSAARSERGGEEHVEAVEDDLTPTSASTATTRIRQVAQPVWSTEGLSPLAAENRNSVRLGSGTKEAHAVNERKLKLARNLFQDVTEVQAKSENVSNVVQNSGAEFEEELPLPEWNIAFEDPDNLHVVYCKDFGNANFTAITVKLSNVSGEAFQNIVSDVTTATNLQCHATGEMPNVLEAKAESSVLFRLSWKNPLFQMQQRFRMSYDHQSAIARKQVFFSIPLSCFDFLRPLQLTMFMFEKLWHASASLSSFLEHSVTLGYVKRGSFKLMSVAELVFALERLHFAHLATAAQPGSHVTPSSSAVVAFFAARLAVAETAEVADLSEDKHVVLLQCTNFTAHCEIEVKAASSFTCENVLRHLQQELQ